MLAPIVCALCWAGRRLLPARMRPWAAGAMFGGGATFLVALPALPRAGQDPNPAVLPLEYGRNTVVVVLLVIGMTIAAAGLTAPGRGGRQALGRARAAPHEDAEDHERIRRRQQGNHPYDREP
ncbi:MAG TPA: hypothetical protein VLW50_06700 [Streptosporangiaceae bacterium]|nr:hypothetical protein [Streptosporangiaceae bacterium]